MDCTQCVCQGGTLGPIPHPACLLAYMSSGFLKAALHCINYSYRYNVANGIIGKLEDIHPELLNQTCPPAWFLRAPGDLATRIIDAKKKGVSTKEATNSS